MTRIYTDQLPDNWKVFLSSNRLRNALKTGIDVLYVNDAALIPSTKLSVFPTKDQLTELFTLVKARSIFGHAGAVCQ